MSFGVVELSWHFWVALNNEVLGADEGEWRGRGSGRSPGKPVGQQHRPVRFPRAKIRDPAGNRTLFALAGGGWLSHYPTAAPANSLATRSEGGENAARDFRPGISGLIVVISRRVGALFIGRRDRAGVSGSSDHPSGRIVRLVAAGRKSTCRRHSSSARHSATEVDQRNDADVVIARNELPSPRTDWVPGKYFFFTTDLEVSLSPDEIVEEIHGDMQNSRYYFVSGYFTAYKGSVCVCVDRTRQHIVRLRGSNELRVAPHNLAQSSGLMYGATGETEKRECGWGKREIPEKIRRRTASSGTIPTCGDPVTRPGIEPGSPWWEASVLIAQPQWPYILKFAQANRARVVRQQQNTHQTSRTLIRPVEHSSDQSNTHQTSRTHIRPVEHSSDQSNTHQNSRTLIRTVEHSSDQSNTHQTSRTLIRPVERGNRTSQFSATGLRRNSSTNISTLLAAVLHIFHLIIPPPRAAVGVGN
ncbi:hypothetical protein PR048_031259 [Dryococelus australis]|uniref:Uncharacterized protein n=1 Tax=Dryococelus australis TaxID=614101 RepID=A0ABQ9G4T1_9NEOP|nr:hypothetical protein PR048_031259 [Dryococelus australis]